MLRGLMLSFAALCAAGATAAAAKPDPAGETVIPFVSSIQAFEWKAVSNNSLYLRGGKGEWYLIRTMNRCSRLLSSHTIGLETSRLDQLDRYGAILVEGMRCPVDSITRSDGPPRKGKKARG